MREKSRRRAWKVREQEKLRYRARMNREQGKHRHKVRKIRVQGKSRYSEGFRIRKDDLWAVKDAGRARSGRQKSGKENWIAFA